MSVIRVNKTKNYTVMSNEHLKDKRLSLKAKGLLSVMLSLPDTWDYSISGLVAICKESETAVKSTLNELKSCGYLVVTKKMPNETESGRTEYMTEQVTAVIDARYRSKLPLIVTTNINPRDLMSAGGIG